MQPISRRSALARLGVLAGGVTGAAMLGSTAASATPLPLMPRATTGPAPGRTITLYARNLHGIGEQRGPHSYQSGEQVVSRADLVDHRGNAIGTFLATGVIIDSPARRVLPVALEQHTFELSDGMVVGSGHAGALSQEAEFAVIGGTGAYIATRGSYTATQQPYHLGGDGSAIFRFHLLGEE